MDLSVTGLSLGAFLVLPGYWASTLQIWCAGATQAEGAGEWLAMSLLRSIALNAIALPLALLLPGLSVSVPLDASIEKVGQAIVALPVITFLRYAGVLYALATLQGLAFGLLQRWTKGLAWAFGWTSMTPYEDVWNDVLSERFRSAENLARKGTASLLCPWLRLTLPDGRVILGRMQRSSVRIEQDKPIEVYLEPVYRLDAGSRTIRSLAHDLVGATDEALYLRLEPGTAVEIIPAVAGWRPSFAAAPPPVAPVPFAPRRTARP
ncbi:DUF6338 family protein [Benzoatithermus flavus]|uniref:DUF6338 family protein n=1 Tax=Benzoatithermus flavus TaxID=3108223 RepID=A0ABU8XQ25_9PROT